MAFTLPPLPYPANALEPIISEKTLNFHHGKHHAAYVNNLNNLLNGHPLAEKSLEEVIHASHGKSDMVGIFNNAAQVWNHTFYWHCMKPQGGGKPSAALADKLAQDFGSLDAFEEAFKQAATTQFGSGWAWLIWDNPTLKVTKTGNAELPLGPGIVPLLTCDVWEHAYYLDYQNRRPDYVAEFFTKLINWDFVEDNFRKAAA